MKKPIALFLSDLHIGEDLGGVSREDGAMYEQIAPEVFVRKEFLNMLDQLKTTYQVTNENRIRYLIVMGDQWDLAVQPMPYTTNLSIQFFNVIGLDKYFEEIIYIPGNHDHHLWRMYQVQKCMIEPLNTVHTGTVQDTKVYELPQVISASIDLTQPDPRLNINSPFEKDPGSSFITGLTGKARIPVNVVYPNLYIIYENGNKEKEAMLATHGHLFDPGWNIVTDLIGPVFKDMGLERMDLVHKEMLNSPVTEFWNYSLTQMGNYNMIEKIYDASLQGKVSELMPQLVDAVYKDIVKWLEKITSGLAQDAVKALDWGIVKSALENKIMSWVKEGLTNVKPDARYDQKFINKNKERISAYLKMSVPYLPDQSITSIKTLVFGHTHVPIINYHDGIPNVDIYNTGGWVNIDSAEPST